MKSNVQIVYKGLSKEQPLVSIIVPTLNSGKTLEKCLASINNSLYGNIELIVVDNFSKDNTKEIALKYTKNVYDKGPERTTQKNFGLSMSKGKYVFFVDSDMELSDSIISDCLKMFENGNSNIIGGICIPEKSIGKGFFVKLRDFERSFYLGTNVESARFFRKYDVQNVGGFEEDLVFFEESLLPQKIEKQLGKSCKYRIDSYINHNEGEIKLLKWLKKKFYYGKSLGLYKNKFKNIGEQKTGQDQISIFKRYMIFLKNKEFYKHPLLGIGVLVLKTLEFFSGALGFLFYKINKG